MTDNHSLPVFTYCSRYSHSFGKGGSAELSEGIFAVLGLSHAPAPPNPPPESDKKGAVKKSKNERMRGVEGSQSPLVGCYWATDREK